MNEDSLETKWNSNTEKEFKPQEDKTIVPGKMHRIQYKYMQEYWIYGMESWRRSSSSAEEVARFSNLFPNIIIIIIMLD